MIVINPNLFPHDGYFFIEKDGAKIFGNSWPGVIKRVAGYRQRAGIPAGDPTAEVMAQACSRHPAYCHETNAGAEQLKVVSLKSRVLKWLSEVRKRRTTDPIPAVPPELAASRREICARCPKNTALPGGCATCKAAVHEIRKEVLAGRLIDGRLNACVVLGEDVAVSCYFDLQTVPNGELPAECWRKRTL